MTHQTLITGCSGGGKSTLINALAQRGHSVVREPGLRILQEERASRGTALPWIDLPAFLWRTTEMSRADLAHMAGSAHPVFYDRGLLDAAVALRHLCNVPFSDTLGPVFPYDHRIILVPPWPEIYVQTDDRRHSFQDAEAEFFRIRRAALELGCQIIDLPRADVAARLEHVERAFGLTI
jgi:predicted ATPase